LGVFKGAIGLRLFLDGVQRFLKSALLASNFIRYVNLLFILVFVKRGLRPGFISIIFKILIIRVFLILVVVSFLFLDI